MAKLWTVKDAVSQASMEIGIAPRPVSTVVGSYDQDIVQMFALLSAVADEVMMEQPYLDNLAEGVWLFSANGDPKMAATDDTDLIGFDGRLAIAGMKYRFLMSKGLEFGEHMRDFVVRLNKLAGRANTRVLDLDEAAGATWSWGGSPWGFIIRPGSRQQ